MAGIWIEKVDKKAKSNCETETKEQRWERRRRRQRVGQRCDAESNRSLSDADRDTFAPELWNCAV